MEEERPEETPLLAREKENESNVQFQGRKWPWMRDIKPYSIYVLLLLLLAYLFNQLDRYLLGITSQPMAQEIHFGDKGCVENKSVNSQNSNDPSCNGTKPDSCNAIVNHDGHHICTWDYNGQGWDYQVLAGPVFILIYTFAGIFIGFASENYNRKFILSLCLIFWSTMTLLTGFVQDYTELVILRFALGLSEAGCTPFATSLIADYFKERSRGTAMSVYNFGIYTGYGLSYAIGNFITLANINGQGWRWAFIIPAIPGIALGVLILLTMREPPRSRSKSSVAEVSDREQDLLANSALARLKCCLRSFVSPSLLLICLAGSIRNAGGYVWAYNTQPYFEAAKVSKATIGTYMSWIPLVGGSLGALFGGMISDKVIKGRGVYARIFVLIGSQILAAPFAAGALFLDAPYSFISLIPSNIIGEMWVGVTLALATELVPSQVRTTAVAVYLFIISNIGGNVPLLVPILQKAFEGNGYTSVEAFRGGLYILYPGLYLVSGFVFLLSLFVVKRDLKRANNSV